jgi:hypothetical protein
MNDWPAVFDELWRTIEQAARRPRPAVTAIPAPPST